MQKNSDYKAADGKWLPIKIERNGRQLNQSPSEVRVFLSIFVCEPRNLRQQPTAE